MVTDGVKDVFQDVIRFFLEKDEIKKLSYSCHVIALFRVVEGMINR